MTTAYDKIMNFVDDYNKTECDINLAILTGIIFILSKNIDEKTKKQIIDFINIENGYNFKDD